MGWLFHAEKLRDETPVQYITRHFTHDSSDLKATVLAAAAVRNTIYAAIRNEDKRTGTAYVFCGVILFKNNAKDGFGYKDMSECMGPCEVDCPDRIMRLLSPTKDIPNSGHAAEWRSCVAERKTAQSRLRSALANLQPGDTVRLAHTIYFPRIGVKADRFRFVERRRKTPIFIAMAEPEFRCRLTVDSLIGATVERAQGGANTRTTEDVSV